MRLGQIDPLFPTTSGDVVGIEIQDLLVFFEGEIVTAGVVIAVGVAQELLHVLDFGDELRAHRFVEIAGLGKMGQELGASRQFGS